MRWYSYRFDIHLQTKKYLYMVGHGLDREEKAHLYCSNEVTEHRPTRPVEISAARIGERGT